MGGGCNPETPGDDGAMLLPQVLRRESFRRHDRQVAQACLFLMGGRESAVSLRSLVREATACATPGRAGRPLMNQVRGREAGRGGARGALRAPRRLLSPFARAGGDRRIDGVSRRWRGSGSTPLHAIDARAVRAARRGPRDGVERGRGTHTPIQADEETRDAPSTSHRLYVENPCWLIDLVNKLRAGYALTNLKQLFSQVGSTYLRHRTALCLEFPPQRSRRRVLF